MKATTSEETRLHRRRGEGIAAFAIVLLHRQAARSTVVPPAAPDLESCPPGEAACMNDPLPRAHGGAPASGVLRAEPDDFCVDELLGFEPSGGGEHAFLVLEKTGANTEWVARQLARAAGVAPVAVGFAGLKDRHAVTRQAFTVHPAGRAEPDWSALAIPGVQVVSATRHSRKLKRGAHRGNRFRIRLR